MWPVWKELIIVMVVAVMSSVVVGFAVWGYLRLAGHRLCKLIEKELPRNGNGPSLSVLLQRSPRDTGKFKKLED